jgi:hypothetical protein
VKGLGSIKRAQVRVQWLDFYQIGNEVSDSRKGLEFLHQLSDYEQLNEDPLPRIQWVPGALFPGVKRQGREAGQSPPSNAEVKE